MRDVDSTDYYPLMTDLVAAGGASGFSATAYQYDAENRLIAIGPTANPADGMLKFTFAYDYLGRRIRKQVYTYNGATIVSGQAKRTRAGQVKTGHLRRQRFAVRPSATRGRLQEARHGEPAQDGQGLFHSGVTRPRLVTAADRPRTWHPPRDCGPLRAKRGGRPA